MREHDRIETDYAKCVRSELQLLVTCGSLTGKEEACAGSGCRLRLTAACHGLSGRRVKIVYGL